jgi:hypothetical protein
MRHSGRNDYYVAGHNVDFHAGGAGLLTIERFGAAEN